MGEGGRQISGGEKQRLALARALVRKPELLILDEVTSALDRANEAIVKQTVERLRGSCTIVILTHSPQILELSDTIVDLGQCAVPVRACQI
ncbi:MAG: ATP-binding cassette domain-containing protein [Novosphingobium sp.]|nr:ATP-binding cassette domain-containing protein [Novosphingobium sp.]